MSYGVPNATCEINRSRFFTRVAILCSLSSLGQRRDGRGKRRENGRGRDIYTYVLNNAYLPVSDVKRLERGGEGVGSGLDWLSSELHYIGT